MHPNEYSREEAVCARFARKIEPTLGFVAYGTIWFFIAGGITAPVMIGTIILLDHLHGTPLPAWSGALIMVVMLGTFLSLWWLFFRWVWRRRRRARQFFMEGVFAEGTIEPMGHTVATFLFSLNRNTGRLKRSTARFTVDGETYLASLIEARPDPRPVGSTCTLLFTPTYPLVVVFEPDGGFTSASWRRADA